MSINQFNKDICFYRKSAYLCGGLKIPNWRRGQWSPLFIEETVLDLAEKIREIVNEVLEDDNLFVVETKVSSGSQKKITVVIDGDKGVNIDDCAKLSRGIGEEIENSDLISSAYVLNVTSAGVEHPLKLERQYRKNVGRTVRVKDIHGEEFEGLLTEADKVGIRVRIKSNKQEIETYWLLEEIEWVKVMVSFK